jgi:hypothetical protein
MDNTICWKILKKKSSVFFYNNFLVVEYFIN